MRRRTVLGLGAAVALLGGGFGFSRLLAPRRSVPRELQRDPSGLLELAKGFTCVVLDRAGDSMTDGHRVPGRPDGMGVFPREGGDLVLMRNHELLPGDDGPGATGALPEAFDAASRGGVTRMVIRPADLRDGKGSGLVSSNLVLAGTNFNCAGGISPLGWLSCEEDMAAGHGWVFACPADAERVVKAEPIRAFGRFRHEAAAFDPATGVVYLTEDRPDGCIYRFVPDRRDAPFEGMLQALAVKGARGVDASATAARGEKRAIEWVPVEDHAPAADEIRLRARERGAAAFQRPEGADFARGELVFTCTSGGRAQLGQVFRLRTEGDGGWLELAHEVTDRAALSMPDNVVVSPWGDLYLAEDGEPPCGIRCLSRGGEVRTLASGAKSGGEIAGVCFAPDGSVLFANLQVDGITVAIVGPFEAFGA